MSEIKTRFLVLSDTHGKNPQLPDLPVDVAIHCGDLTDGSKIAEFRTTLALLRFINAPLKLVIAGNHDFTLDTPMFQRKVAEANRLFSIAPGEMEREYGDFGDARRLLDSAQQEGIIFLDEGVHRFDLNNGARLTVYASPFTPSIEADWGFQYRRGEHHDYAVDGVEIGVMITHGPPKGVLDMTTSKKRGGCEQLFEAVARTRPRLHCFGHIHEGWGAKAVTWRGSRPSESPSHFTDINNGASAVIESLASLRPGKYDTADLVEEKEARLRAIREVGYRHTSHCAGDEHGVNLGQTTVFVNAAMQPANEVEAGQLPWIVDIELPPAAAFLNGVSRT